MSNQFSRIEDVLQSMIDGTTYEDSVNNSRIEELLTRLAGSVVTLDEDGLIPLNKIPPEVIERIYSVANDVARFSLTSNDVQNGDTVYVDSTKTMYLVVDETKLNVQAGYKEYSAGTAVKAIADKNGNDITTTYATKSYVDLLVGDINTVLEEVL